MGSFELWDAAGGNLLGVWETEREALAVVRDLLAENGAELAVDLVLGHVGGDASDRATLEGGALAQRALAISAA
jgi:hypothetical protein